ncbi:MAG: SIMPL domain-containing protein [Candidatus Gracilibacteria bacterium]|jgi:hypothetical protein
MNTTPHWEVPKRLYVLIVIFLLFLVSFWSFRMYEIYNTATGGYPREISIEGKGKAYAIPDVAKISLGVTTDGATSEVTVLDNTKKINAIMAELENFKIDKKDIQTTNYYLNPKYDYTPDKGNFQNGYTLSQNIEIKVRDFTKIGDIIAKTTKVGANMVGGINFTVDDTDKAKAEARVQAIAKARENAKSIADAAGLKLGKVLSYYEYVDAGYPDYGKGGGMMASSADVGGPMPVSPTIEPGQQEVSITVNLSYRIY